MKLYRYNSVIKLNEIKINTQQFAINLVSYKNKICFQAGAIAGLSVDVALYPLDTLKTRLQSQHGFYKSGGFSGVYRGRIQQYTRMTKFIYILLLLHI